MGGLVPFFEVCIRHTFLSDTFFFFPDKSSFFDSFISRVIKSKFRIIYVCDLVVGCVLFNQVLNLDNFVFIKFIPTIYLYY